MIIIICPTDPFASLELQNQSDLEVVHIILKYSVMQDMSFIDLLSFRPMGIKMSVLLS